MNLQCCSNCEALRLQRFTVSETCRILKMGRTKLWQRYVAGDIEGQRDGGRLYFTAKQITEYQARLLGV